MNFFRSRSTSLLLFLVLGALGTTLGWFLYHAESRAVAQQLIGFPDSDVLAHQLRPYILGGLCFLPALACLFYSLGGTLDRYVARQFLGIFMICISGLLMIWLLFDLSDNISEFREVKSLPLALATFYGIRAPAILLQLLPYSLLLALLYSLGKLSTSREIIAMIQSGRGVIRITLPLIIAGAFCTLLTMGLNYHWAPTADGRQNEILAEASGKQVVEASQVLFRNPDDRRLWMIGSFPTDYQKGAPLRDIEITTVDRNQRLESRLSASQARWNRETRDWSFDNAMLGRYSPGNPPTFEKSEGPLLRHAWSETPWQLIKPGLSAGYLGIPGLNTWLQANARHSQFADPAPYLTQWHYRWALPFTCLVTVLLATPLAIHFSRRGPGGGIFLAVVLCAAMLVTSSITLAFGEAGSIDPAMAAWMPNITFTLLGFYLFRRRITGRPIYHSLRKLVPGTD